jgi:hypothetical protein
MEGIKTATFIKPNRLNPIFRQGIEGERLNFNAATAGNDAEIIILTINMM